MQQAPASQVGALAVRDLHKRFGGVHALRGVSFDVAPGECVALIGPNGAGKSTCFACVAGQHRADGGEVRFDGRLIDGLSPAQRLQGGLARCFQVAQVFEALPVIDNVRLCLAWPGRPPGALAMAWRGLLGMDRLPRDEALALLGRVGLADRADDDAAALSYGAKKRLELAMALAARPRLLLLDEPAAGLAADERAALMALVRELCRGKAGEAGLAVLYTEHNMDAVFGVADRVLVLIDGQLAAQGSADAVRADPQVRARYLGAMAGDAEPQA